jgi:uncharacterized Tic20 family protein
MASAAPFPPEASTTQDERTMAVLAHVLQIIGGWIAPLVIFFMRRQSRFVSFHSLQVLLFEILCMILTMIAMVGLFLALAVGFSIGALNGHDTSKGVPAFFFIFFGIFWLPFAILGLLRLILAIVYGLKAGRGEWAEYPLLGRLARHILSIGPGGAIVAP